MKFDVVGVGAALLDLVIEVPEETLDQFDLEKGTMHLVADEESSYILKHLETYKQHTASGGSVANSCVNLSALENKTVFFGAVGNDPFAETFRNDMKNASVDFHSNTDHKKTTGHAITLITPDGERTFATNIGAAHSLTLNAKSIVSLKNTKIFYIEGYLLDNQQAQKFVFDAAKVAKEHNADIAIDMSNVSLVRGQHDALRELIESYATVCFANVDEARAYTGKDAPEALEELASVCDVAVITQSEKGSLIKANNTTYKISSVTAQPFVNTNGAGDMYAAGILHGIVKGLSLEKAGEIASFFAAKTVEINEARLPVNYVKNEYKKRFA